MIFVGFVQVYVDCNATVSGLRRIAWNYFQLQQNCLHHAERSPESFQ